MQWDPDGESKLTTNLIGVCAGYIQILLRAMKGMILENHPLFLTKPQHGIIHRNGFFVDCCIWKSVFMAITISYYGNCKWYHNSVFDRFENINR